MVRNREDMACPPNDLLMTKAAKSVCVIPVFKGDETIHIPKGEAEKGASTNPE